MSTPPRRVSGRRTLERMNGTRWRPSEPGRTLVTGGAGFIATNLARRLLDLGRPVVLFDNLSRRGVDQNLRWMERRYGRRLEVRVGDVRDPAALAAALDGVSHVFHLAAQVAVTTSLTHPIDDFDVNARGTLNLLEILRTHPEPPTLVFTSTNKVYGELGAIPLRRTSHRYEPVDPVIRAHGVPETQALAFHSPYGCSKGAADQYVLDYARTFGLRAAVLRMSCIYGPHQYGNEDQGWVAHFLIRALRREPITIYGDGCQVRDLLFVDDLVDAMLRLEADIDSLAGEAFNMGGGPDRTVSLHELLELMGETVGTRPAATLAPWRRADQRYYVSDSRKFQRATGWTPRVDVPAGVEQLAEWLRHEVADQPLAAQGAL